MKEGNYIIYFSKTTGKHEIGKQEELAEYLELVDEFPIELYIDILMKYIYENSIQIIFTESQVNFMQLDIGVKNESDYVMSKGYDNIMFANGGEMIVLDNNPTDSIVFNNDSLIFKKLKNTLEEQLNRQLNVMLGNE